MPLDFFDANVVIGQPIAKSEATPATPASLLAAMDGYLHEMERMSAEVGRMSECSTHAEGWRLHNHDNPSGIHLTALMISKRIPDAAVPMSLLADHPNVSFNYLRSGIRAVGVEMH